MKGIVGNLTRQKKHSAILLTINEKGGVNQLPGQVFPTDKTAASQLLRSGPGKIVIEKQTDSSLYGMLF